jgi:spectrin beta
MEEIKLRLLSDDYGKHLMGVEDLLQKHSLVEADVNVLGERVKAVVQQSQRFLDQETVEGYRPCDPTIIVERVQQLEVCNKIFTCFVLMLCAIINVVLFLCVRMHSLN